MSGGLRDATGALIHLVEGMGAPRACDARTERVSPQRLHNTNQGEQGEIHRAHREARRRTKDRPLRDASWSAPSSREWCVRARSGGRAARRGLCSAGALCRCRPSRTSQADLLRTVRHARAVRGWCRGGRLWRPVRVEFPTRRRDRLRSLGPSTVVKLDPSGSLLSPPSPFGSAHYSGVAVNPTNGDVYVLGEEGGHPLAAYARDDLRLRPQHGRVAVVV